MTVIYVLLILAGVICFIADAFGKRSARADLSSLGLALVFLVPLISYFRQL